MKAAFSLVELLIVIAIMVIAMGMLLSLTTSDRREAAVSAAAQELAATLRTARAMAIDRRGQFAVAFNLANAPGTSGLVLNNHGGGHWYRITGPTDNLVGGGGFSVYPQPAYYANNTIGSYLKVIDACWCDDRHVLPPGRVRFLALSDQDNGSLIDTAQAGTWSSFLPTYPRPWFGNWDAASGRLRGWGAYDPAITSPVESPARQCSGFYVAGRDGTITGSVNPADRTSSDGARILKQGDGRPIINAQWLDYCLQFQPDGSVSEAVPFPERLWSMKNQPGPFGDLGDFSGWPANAAWYSFSDSSAFGQIPRQVGPMVSYAPITGWWAITLGPDMAADSDRFASAQEAVASLMPACRVMVNRFGTVKVVRVGRSLPAGAVFDTVITDWTNSAQVRASYWGCLPTRADRSFRCTPVAETVNERMLTANAWWLAAPP